MIVAKSTNDQPSHKVGFHPIVWWLALGVASVCLSQFFEAFRQFTLTPDSVHGTKLALFIGLTFLSIVTLIFDGYSKDRYKGKVVRQFFVFERLYQHWYGDVHPAHLDEPTPQSNLTGADNNHNETDSEGAPDHVR